MRKIVISAKSTNYLLELESVNEDTSILQIYEVGTDINTMKFAKEHIQTLSFSDNGVQIINEVVL